MKANDLMVGDWVNIYVFPNEIPQKEDLFPARINAIMTPLPNEGGQENIECIFNTIDGGTGCASRPVYTCQPIPLSPEILEKNGFETEDAKDGGFVLCDDYFDIFIYEWSDSIWVARYESTEMNMPFEQATMSYVHELQHFLKSNGIEKEIEL